ncbi:phosphodiester glycosidase family protein [Defluviimonas sp. SAOS-178_SWC]|uniref:phosphodiester glycosidase family protein n=1 Tax=Defluviimonas sp. SAOS-178_SWC TaxID=3121287 RepID=UPI0032220952
MTTTMAIWARAAAAVLLLAGAAQAESCHRLEHEGEIYAVCEAVAGEDLRLFLEDADGATIGTFERLREGLAAEGRRLVFAMNAGMYHPDRRPVGLYRSEGRDVSRLVTSAGPGNFGLVPNGVFCIRPQGFAVIETLSYERAAPDCRFATQSGPMLVIGGALHPKFLEDSDSRYVRNGVGVSADGSRAYFVISDGAVNFHAFARFFRDALGVPDALYFDGNVSRLYAPEIRRDDFGFPMGPIVGLSVPAD